MTVLGRTTPNHARPVNIIAIRPAIAPEHALPQAWRIAVPGHTAVLRGQHRRETKQRRKTAVRDWPSQPTRDARGVRAAQKCCLGDTQVDLLEDSVAV